LGRLLILKVAAHVGGSDTDHAGAERLVHDRAISGSRLGQSEDDSGSRVRCARDPSVDSKRARHSSRNTPRRPRRCPSGCRSLRRSAVPATCNSACR
jgi:hypothetical protein